MADMIRKLMPVEVKEVGDRTLEFTGSTEDVDRMGDIISASGWKLKNFKKNPVFMWAHDYSKPPIGRAVRVWVDKETKRLMFKVEFAGPEVYEFADTIYKLYQGGFLHATSVGFIPLDWEGKSEEHPYPKWEDNVYLSQELLELSAVPVPANANALESARDQGFITVKEFEALGDIVKKGKEKRDTQRQKLEEFEELLRETEPEETEEVTGSESAELSAVPEQKETPEPRAISQEQLADELDFTIAAIQEVGLSDEQMPIALNLASEIIQRSTGNDIPDNILSKVGSVLNDRNEERLHQIRQLAQDVMESAATTEEEGEKQVSEPQPDSVADARQRAIEVAEVAEIVIAKLKGKRIR